MIVIVLRFVLAPVRHIGGEEVVGDDLPMLVPSSSLPFDLPLLLSYSQVGGMKTSLSAGADGAVTGSRAVEAGVVDVDGVVVEVGLAVAKLCS